MIGRIATLFDQKEINIPLWITIGPFFLMVSLVLSTFFGPPNPYLFFIAIFGPILCLRFSMKGLFTCLTLLLCISIISHLERNEIHFWKLGLEISFALGLTITAFSLDFISSLIDEEKKSISTFQIEKLAIEEKYLQKKEQFDRYRVDTNAEFNKLEEDLEKIKIDCVAFQQLVNLLKSNEIQTLSVQRKLLDEKIQRDHEIIRLNYEVEDFKEKNQTLLDSLNDLRCQAFQQETIARSDLLFSQRKETLSSAYQMKIQAQELEYETLFHKLIGCQKEVDELVLQLEKTSVPTQEILCKEDLHIKNLYLQLKKQFNDKSDLLHQTRKELFYLNEKFLGQENQSLELKHQLPEESRLLIKDFCALEQEKALIEKENKALQEMISSLVKTKLYAVERNLPFNFS